jgi:hypothetical protein
MMILQAEKNPKRSKGHYGKWLGDKKPLSHSDKSRQTIDEVLAKKPTTFNEFLQLIQGAGYEIKSGKHYFFKGAEQKKFIRLRSLDEGYSEDEIKAVIEGKAPQREVKKTAEKRIAEIQALKKHIFNYAKTRDIYTDYRKAGYSKKFYEEHRAELTLHKAAMANIDRLLGL